MRHSIQIQSSTITAVLAILTLTSLASADPAAVKKKKVTKKTPTTEVAFVVAPDANLEPLPPPPPPAAAPAPAPAPKDQPAESAPSSDPSPTGFVLSFGSGLGVMKGKIGGDLDVGGAFLTFDLKLGAYVTPHVGFLIGLEGGTGGLFDGCAGTCSGYMYQIPILAQYTLQDRTRGAYFEGGLAIMSTYGGSSDPDKDAAPEALQVSSPFDLKLGMGYRIPVAKLSNVKAPSSSLDIHAGLDLGEFKKVEYHSVAGSVEGDIPSEKQALHAMFGLSVAYQFSP